MIEKIRIKKDNEKMFESETNFEVDRCIFCESENIVIKDAFGNKFKCEECGAEFSIQDIQKFIDKNMIKVGK